MRTLLNLSRVLMQPAQTKPESDIRTQTYEDVLVIGQVERVAIREIAPEKAISVRIDVSGEVEVASLSLDKPLPVGTILSLDKAPAEIAISAQNISEAINDRSLKISFLDRQDKTLVSYRLRLTALRICLDVDADRDDRVEEDSPDKAHWRWGPDGHGAVLLVNNDQDRNSPSDRSDFLDDRINGPLDLKDLSRMVVNQPGPDVLPAGCELRLHVTDDAAKRIRVFDRFTPGGRQLLGPGVPTATLPDIQREIRLVVEGLQYPDVGFDGLVTINLSLVRRQRQLYSDRVVFRVAPWIMTPNTLRPIQVYVSRLADGSNQKFIRSLALVVKEAGAKLVEVPPDLNRGDKWMQDETEIGYSQSARIKLPVVLDSPRNRGLDIFPEKGLLGPDFGYVTRGKDKPNSLDSFGNLEVSPPVTVNGVDYPLGRIIFGGAMPVATAGRRLMRAVRDFLYAQKVQAPIEVYSDWLTVGHVDEFMSFVPAPTAKGFKLLLASPNKCYALLKGLDEDGHGRALLREGKELGRKRADISVSKLLDLKDLAGDNYRYQGYIDWNRMVLKQELGLEEEDIIDLPALYESGKLAKAETYLPNMVNMIVLGKHLGIAKPYGPKVQGKCQFEAYVEDVLGKLGLVCHFLDDFDVYFREFGDVHCGTNVLRESFTEKWWNLKPPATFDV
jgi:protein-arginine deiminase